MVFSSVIFLAVFLPICFLLYYLPFGMTYKNTILVIASLLFYAFGEPVYVFLMIGSVFMNYLFGRGISAILEKRKQIRNVYLLFSVVFNIGLLCVFKYAGFLAKTFNYVTKAGIPVPEIALPIGISFFTFQAMSYVIDVYRGETKAQTNFWKLLLYISFFPQLIAGPIVRYHDIDRQLTERGRCCAKEGQNIWNGAAPPQMIAEGIERFIKGLAKKMIIANAMAGIADKVYDLDIQTLNAGVAWMGAICYTIQIYYDFSGYSDMAIGLAKMFGFSFLENFDHPYSACSIKEFWRRWHISLSSWFKEYVYIPLGGNRKGRLRTEWNKILVFFLTGFWHGANLTFIVWGLFHGLFLVLEDTILPIAEWQAHQKSRGKDVCLKGILHIYTMGVVITGFVFFRSEDMTAALVMLRQMFTGFFASPLSRGYVLEQMSWYNLFVFAMAVLFSFPVAGTIAARYKEKKWYTFAVQIGSICLLALCILNLASAAYNPFIYFRF